jgi:magnesium transporter
MPRIVSYRPMILNEVQLDGFKWVDITKPTKEMLQQIASDLGLSPRIVLNCLNSDYLPHIETFSGVQFVLLRLMEPKTEHSADSVQELTTKIAIFVTQDKLISLHRLPLGEIKRINERIQEPNKPIASRQKLLSYFYEQVSLGFDGPLGELETKLQSFEEALFNKNKSKNFIQDGFYLKRKASALKKVLKLTLELMNKLIIKIECTPESFQESKDRLERSLFYAEDVYENIQSLMSLHMSIEAQKTNQASYRTNEIMRVLTVLTIFFLPLNFIAGVFGMNFGQMPFLQHEQGFWISILSMFLISSTLAIYLFKQGWLLKPDIMVGREKSNDD